MEIAIEVRTGAGIGTGFCEVYDADKDLPVDELIKRYVMPAFMFALSGVRDGASLATSPISE